MKMRWQIRFTPATIPLPTGDEPVYYTKLGQPTTLLIFPVSSNAVFTAYNNSATNEIIYLEENPEIVSSLMSALTTKCRELYHSVQDERIVNLFNEK